MKTEEKIKELFDKIEQLKKEVEHLKNDFEKPTKWQDGLVQPSEEYYYKIEDIDDSAFSIKYEGYNSSVKPEHAFRTEQQAELIKEKMLLMQEMFAFAHVRNDGKIFDWSKGNYQDKFGIEMFEGRCRINRLWVNNCFVFSISVKSKEIAKEMLQIFGERIEKYYNKQY